MASIINPVAMELHRELNSKRKEAKPYFRAKILPDLTPKNAVLTMRWLALYALFVRAAKPKLAIAVEAVNIATI
ncbi:hypothetical protein ACLB2K_065176 [Fragaria x ananassa]